MKSRIRALCKASDNEILHQAILQSMLTEISNNQDLQNKIGEVLPFLTDGDRSIRKQALQILQFYNSEFRIPIVQEAVCDMAATKLSDSACIDISCEIIQKNLSSIINPSQISNIFNTLINIDVRANLFSQRCSAYNLLNTLLNLKPPQIDAIQKLVKDDTQKVITSFKKFCDFESDPRCLKIVFDLFPGFVELIIQNGELKSHDRNELFDTIGVYYPITNNESLATDLSHSLSSNSIFADDLAALLALKLKNSMQDTRAAVFSSLPILLKNENTSPQHVESVISSFIIALHDHFDSNSTSVPDSIVLSALDSISNFVLINKSSHKLMEQVAINDWIPQVLSSTSPTTIRAYAVVSWYVDLPLHFTSQVMPQLAETIDKALKTNDEARAQSLLASLVEYLKIQPEQLETERKDLETFLHFAISILQSTNHNLLITGLVFIREFATHFFLPVNETLIPQIIQKAHVQPFSTQCLTAISNQKAFSDLIHSQFISPLIDSILSKKDFYGLSGVSLIDFASSFANVPLLSEPIFDALAKSGFYKVLLKSILPQKELTDSISRNLLNYLKDIGECDDLLIAICIRSSDAVIKEQLITNYQNTDLSNPIYVKNKELLFSTARTSSIPDEFDVMKQINTERLDLLYSAKYQQYPTGFKPNKIALALRNDFCNEFEITDIPLLLDFENQFDCGLGENFTKLELISNRFIYNDEYKTTLWEQWHDKVKNHPECYLKLCLLCPPHFFISDIFNIIPLFPIFMKSDIKESLDLLIFTIMSMTMNEDDSQDPQMSSALLSQLQFIIPILLEYLDYRKTEDAHIRLDVCKVISLMPLAVSLKELKNYKSVVVKALRVVLDDPKREVRQSAAQANMMWLKIH